MMDEAIRHAVAKACCAGWYAGGIYGLSGKHLEAGLRMQQDALDEADKIIERLAANGIRLVLTP